jgi:hypothetical protein
VEAAIDDPRVKLSRKREQFKGAHTPGTDFL